MSKKHVQVFFLIALAKELLTLMLKFIQFSNLETKKNGLPTVCFTDIYTKTI